MSKIYAQVLDEPTTASKFCGIKDVNKNRPSSGVCGDNPGSGPAVFPDWGLSGSPGLVRRFARIPCCYIHTQTFNNNNIVDR